jgi:hypothetical protein
VCLTALHAYIEQARAIQTHERRPQLGNGRYPSRGDIARAVSLKDRIETRGRMHGSSAAVSPAAAI